MWGSSDGRFFRSHSWRGRLRPVFRVRPIPLSFWGFDAGFIDREDLLQKNYGRFFKGRVGIHQHMGGLVFLLFRPGGNSCNDQCRRMTVSNVVLQNYHRAFPSLFRADMRLHVCIVDVPSEISPIVRQHKNQPPFYVRNSRRRRTPRRLLFRRYSIFKVCPAAAPAPFRRWAAAVTIVYRTFEQEFMDS